MSLKDTISSDIKDAMHAKDAMRLTVLRQLSSAVGNEAISLGKKDEGLDDEAYLKVVKREARKRQDAIGQYIQAGRDELAENEKKELEILQAYLPAQMTEEAVRRIVEEVVKELQEGVSSPASAEATADSVLTAVGTPQFGQVMSLVMKKVGDSSDGNTVSSLVKEVLSQTSE